MAQAEPVIRAALPDANVPTSIRSSGLPVVHGSVTDLDGVLDGWLTEQADGIACVIGAPAFPPAVTPRPLADPGTLQGPRIRPGRPRRPGAVRRGRRRGGRPLCGDDPGDPATGRPARRLTPAGRAQRDRRSGPGRPPTGSDEIGRRAGRPGCRTVPAYTVTDLVGSPREPVDDRNRDVAWRHLHRPPGTPVEQGRHPEAPRRSAGGSHPQLGGWCGKDRLGMIHSEESVAAELDRVARRPPAEAAPPVLAGFAVEVAAGPRGVRPAGTARPDGRAAAGPHRGVRRRGPARGRLPGLVHGPLRAGRRGHGGVRRGRADRLREGGRRKRLALAGLDLPVRPGQ
ncbi:hypothetical protein SGLAM104S_08002 [Streptomyces glaucescens]